MSGGEALTGMGMQDSGFRKPPVQQWDQTIPPHLRALTATDQNIPPEPTNATPEEIQLRRISWNRVVSVVAQYDFPQPFTYLSGAMVLSALKFGLNELKLRCHPLCGRNPPDGKGPAAPELPTEMGESQKRESLGFSLATPFSVAGSRPPEFDQSRLVRVQFQVEASEPFPKLLEETLGVGSTLKAHHKIIRIPDDN
jgi:hypothetical protein